MRPRRTPMQGNRPDAVAAKEAGDRRFDTNVSTTAERMNPSASGHSTAQNISNARRSASPAWERTKLTRSEYPGTRDDKL